MLTPLAGKKPVSDPPDHESMVESELIEDESTESSVALDAIVESVEIDVDTPVAATPHIDDGPLDAGSPCSLGEAASVEGDEEEFTEASLQLDIQRQCDERSPLIEDHHQVRTPEPILDTRIAGPEFGGDCTQTPEVEDSDKEQPPPSDVYDDVLPQLSLESSYRDPVEPRTDDITDGLTLSCTPATSAPAGPIQRRLQSPPPPPRTESGPDDFTMTVAIDDDTAILKDFLTRAAASKAEKAATHRRESLQNRRDSDVIRNALASPRKVLEDKDPNSPSKYDGELMMDLSQTTTLSLPIDAKISPTPNPVDEEGTLEEKTLPGSTRRSSRTKRSRLPALASASAPITSQPQTSRINIRRTDGADLVVLKKSDAQELSTLTRANTRKNKQGAFCVTVRLFKLAVDAASLPPINDAAKEPVVGKNVRWDETLAYYQENPETVAEAESLATPDELSMEAVPTPRTKSKMSKSSTPKTRRVKTINGTPGKGLRNSTPLLSEPIQDAKEQTLSATAAAAPPRPKAPRTKKTPITSTAPEAKLHALDVTATGAIPPSSSSSSSSRKSRLAAPKKVVLPPSAPPTATTMMLPGVADGKENTHRSGSHAGAAALKKKQGISAPQRGGSVAVAVAVGVASSGLPRRRGRPW